MAFPSQVSVQTQGTFTTNNQDFPVGKCGRPLEASQRRAQPDFGGLGWLAGLSWPEIAPSRLVCLAWFGIAIWKATNFMWSWANFSFSYFSGMTSAGTCWTQRKWLVFLRTEFASSSQELWGWPRRMSLYGLRRRRVFYNPSHNVVRFFSGERPSRL